MKYYRPKSQFKNFYLKIMQMNTSGAWYYFWIENSGLIFRHMKSYFLDSWIAIPDLGHSTCSASENLQANMSKQTQNSTDDV